MHHLCKTTQGKRFSFSVFLHVTCVVWGGVDIFLFILEGIHKPCCIPVVSLLCSAGHNRGHRSIWQDFRESFCPKWVCALIYVFTFA